MVAPRRLLLINAVLFFMVLLCDTLLSRGVRFRPPQRAPFDYATALAHQKNFSNDVRVLGSENFNQTLSHMFVTFAHAQQRKEQQGALKARLGYSESSLSYVTTDNVSHIPQGLRNYFAVFDNMDRMENWRRRPLFVGLRHDSAYEGIEYYESVVYTSAILEVITAMSQVLNHKSRPVTFIFLNNWLHERESLYEILRNNCSSGNFLFLRSIGVGPPFAMVDKSNASSSMLRALRKIPGIVMYSGLSRLFGTKSKLWSMDGGLTLGFLGNPKYHRTKLDVDRSQGRDMRYVGEAMLSLSLDPEVPDEDEEAFSFGIAPFVLIVRESLWKKVTVCVFVVSFALILLHYQRTYGTVVRPAVGILRRGCYVLCIVFVVCVCYLLFGFALAVMNPGSCEGFSYISYFVLVAAIECLFLSMLRSELEMEWRGLHIVLLAVAALVLRDRDESMCLVLTLLPQLVLYGLSSFYRLNRVVALMLVCVSLLPSTFLFALVMKPLSQTLAVSPKITADIVPLLGVLLYSLNFLLSAMPFILADEKEKFQYTGELLYVAMAIFFYFLVQPFAFTMSDSITGTFTEFLFSNRNDCVVVFRPDGSSRLASRIAGGLKKPIRYEPHMDPIVLNRPSGAVFTATYSNISRTDIPDMRHCHVASRTTTGRRRVKIRLDKQIAENVRQVALVIYCPTRSCLAPSMGNPPHVTTRESNNTVILMYSGMSNSFSAEIELKSGMEDSLRIDMLLMLRRSTPQKRKFLSAFPDYVQDRPDPMGIGGSVFVHTLKL